MNVKISGLITTYNESQYLDECLERISFCDEIIVVDLGSTDNCTKIAEKHGAKVFYHELVPFAEKVREFAISKAKNDWVLFTDPDMYFPKGIGEKIDRFLTDCPPNIGLVHIPARRYFNHQIIRFGSKSEIESRVAIINRNRVQFLPLLHYSGYVPKDNIHPVGLLVNEDEFIEHHWVDTLGDAVEKALRYLPHEPERRRYLYKKISIKVMAKEIYKTIRKDIKLGALKNKTAFGIMLFNLWYVFQANFRWICFEISSPKNNP